MNDLLNELLPAVQQMLEEHGGFYPIGAEMGLDGKVELVGVYSDEEYPDPNDLIVELTANLRQRAENQEIIASGIAYDVSITLPGTNKATDAICIALESNDEAMSTYLPYTLRANEKPVYEKLVATDRDPTVFVSSSLAQSE